MIVVWVIAFVCLFACFVFPVIPLIVLTYRCDSYPFLIITWRKEVDKTEKRKRKKKIKQRDEMPWLQ